MSYQLIFTCEGHTFSKLTKGSIIMAQFMPTDEQAAQELEARLAQSIFRSSSDFIGFYNSGLINKKFDDVVETVRQITSVYRDVREKSGKLIIVSHEELFLSEIREELGVWSLIVPLKSHVRDLLAEEVVGNDEVLLFSPDEVGFALKREGADIEKVSEKMFNKQSDIIPVYEMLSTVKNENLAQEGSYRFKVSDLANVDTSFITKMRELLPQS